MAVFTIMMSPLIHAQPRWKTISDVQNPLNMKPESGMAANGLESPEIVVQVQYAQGIKQVSLCLFREELVA